MGDLLSRLNEVIDFEMFRSELEECVIPKERVTNAGAKRYDPVLMFKILVLQRLYGTKYARDKSPLHRNKTESMYIRVNGISV